VIEGEIFYQSRSDMTAKCIVCGMVKRIDGICPNCKPAQEWPQQPAERTGIGLKFDSGKKDWSLLELEFVEPLVAVFELGEKRYGFENWKREFDNEQRRFRSAIKRHTLAVEKHGASATNPEDGDVYHAAQIAWNALRLLWGELKRQEAADGK